MAPKTEIRNYFVHQLPALLPNLTIERFQLDEPFNGSTFDFVAQVTVRGVPKTLLGEVESVGQPRYLRQAITELRERKPADQEAYPIVAAPFLSKRGMEICRKNQVGGIDLAGNLYLEFDGIYIERIVQANPQPTRRAIKSLFTPIASRIVRILLENSKQTWRISTLAELSGASVGQVFNVAQKLADKGFAHKTREGITLIEPGNLLDAWQGQYSLEANQIQSYSLLADDEPAFFQQLQALHQQQPDCFACTFETGYQLLTTTKTDTLSLDDIRLYIIPTQIKAIIQALNLQPTAFGGNIHLLTPYDDGIFYNLQEAQGVPIVSNTQLYLDLRSDSGSGRQQAQQFRASFMAF